MFTVAEKYDLLSKIARHLERGEMHLDASMKDEDTLCVKERDNQDVQKAREYLVNYLTGSMEADPTLEFIYDGLDLQRLDSIGVQLYTYRYDEDTIAITAIYHSKIGMVLRFEKFKED